MRHCVSVLLSLFRFLLHPLRKKYSLRFAGGAFLTLGLLLVSQPSGAKKPQADTTPKVMRENQKQAFLAKMDRSNRVAQQLHYAGKHLRAEQLLSQNITALGKFNFLEEKVAIQAYFLLGKVYAMEGKGELSKKAFYAALRKYPDLTPQDPRDAGPVLALWKEVHDLVAPPPVQPPTLASETSDTPDALLRATTPEIPKKPEAQKVATAPETTPPPPEPTSAPRPEIPILRPPIAAPVSPQMHRFYAHLGLGGGGFLVSEGAPLDTLWGFTTKTGLYQPGSIRKTGFSNAGLILQAELGVRLSKRWALGLAGALQTYLDNNVSSEDWTTPSVCTDGQGQPLPCYPTQARERFGFRVVGKLRYHIPVASRWIQPYVFGALGGGQWRGTITVDVARESAAGRPIFTDRCSAISQGTAIPEECRSADGKPGFNAATQAMMPFDNARLNRVCPVGQPCLDTVGNAGFMVGAGGGFYVGTPRIGGFVEVSALALIGSSSGMILDAAMGPQLSF